MAVLLAALIVTTATRSSDESSLSANYSCYTNDCLQSVSQDLQIKHCRKIRELKAGRTDRAS